jgi:endonuclease YncB( thermonuclease family)
MRTLLTALFAFAVLAFSTTPAALAVSRGRCLPDNPHSPKCLIWNAKVTFVADGDTVDAAIQGVGKRRIRVTGINAMELSRYSRTPSRRRGACHGVAATTLLERMIRKSHWRVRLAAQHTSSHSGARLRRSIQVRSGGRWQDAGPAILRAGLALWLPNGPESAWNHSYSLLAQKAAARGVGLYDTSSCGAGPEAGARLRLRVNWDANGSDTKNVNGEFFEVTNLDPSHAVRVGHWWVRDSDLRQYTLPAGATIPAGGQIRVHIGRGHARGTSFFWGFSHPIFDPSGDGGYLFDTQGDLRAWMIYPCTFHCADPLAGKVRLGAHPGGQEYVTLRNVSGSAENLDGYVLGLPYHDYEFGSNSTLQPGETMVVEIEGNPSRNTRLHRYYGFGRQMLADGGQQVVLRSYLGTRVACTAWGRYSC